MQLIYSKNPQYVLYSSEKSLFFTLCHKKLRWRRIHYKQVGPAPSNSVFVGFNSSHYSYVVL